MKKTDEQLLDELIEKMGDLQAKLNQLYEAMSVGISELQSRVYRCNNEIARIQTKLSKR